MKRAFIVLSCLLISICTFADNPARDTSAATEDTQQQILEALQGIREVQDSTYNQRMRAVKARNAITHESELSPSEYSILSGIENNTDSKFLLDSWNLYGIFALIFTIWGLYFAWKQYNSQKETEKHTENSERQTKNAPISVQKSKLEALPRHFYRNLVCTEAIIFNHLQPSNGISAARKAYPSESNLLKLQTLPDDIFLPIDIDEESYRIMHELRLLFRNYNTEINVAAEHLSRRHLTDESLVQDFDNLLFKPLSLTKRTFEYEEILCKINQKELTTKAAYTIIDEHFKKFKEPGNFSILIRPKNNGFLKLLLDNNFAYISELDKKGALARSINFFSKEDFAIRKAKCSDEHIDFIKGISAEKETFIEWFNKHYKGQIVDTMATLTVDELYDSLKPYLNYIVKEEWNFKVLIYYILSVDIAIETDRIGMINHKSDFIII